MEDRPRAAPPPRPRVLIVDDSPNVRTYMIHLLGPGFAVEAVGDGKAALRAARQRPPDVILSDVMMPELDGFGLLREVRADPVLRAVPFIMLSARPGDDSAAEGVEAGADDYLVKPFSARDLMARVNTHLEMARVRREVARHQVVEADLREALKVRDEFLSIAAHELRTPVSALSLTVHTLVRQLEDLTAEDPELAPVSTKASNAQKQVRRLTKLIEELLDVSQIAARRMPLVQEEVDLRSLVNEVLERNREALTAAGCGVALTLPDAGVVICRCDRVRIEQVLGNLLSNAMKYGSGKPVEVTLEPQDGGARLTVTDHGIGIEPEHLARIFGRFERAVSERHYGGFGLGLWIARQVVEAHGGQIEVTSRPGGGSRFAVWLPERPVRSR